jgi:hypothetical protein
MKDRMNRATRDATENRLAQILAQRNPRLR